MARTYFFWDDLEDNIIEEYDDAGVTIADYTTEPHHFGNVISQHRNGQTSFFHYDALGSTLAVTDENQQVTDTRAYLAFGEVGESTGSTAFPFQFVGQQGYYRDELLGDIVVRRRQLSPEIGRWLSLDPVDTLKSLISADSQPREHPFVYVRNNPTLATDPSALITIEVVDIAPRCTDKQKELVKATMELACKKVKDDSDCLPPILKECMALMCEGKIAILCVRICDSDTCGIAHTIDGALKDLKDPSGSRMCESWVPKGRLPAITLCMTSSTGNDAGLENPGNCKGKLPSAEVIVFHEMLHLCGTGAHTKVETDDKTYACQKKCYPTSTVGDPAKCNCC